MKKPRNTVIIAVGGTGGHLYPAQAFARDLQEVSEEVSLLFAGKGLAKSSFFQKKQFSYEEIDASPFVKKKLLSFFLSTSKGLYQALSLLKREKPRLVVGFGSFYSLPILLAAKILRIPIVLFESNAIPGKVNKLFAKTALFSGLYFPCAGKLLKGKAIPVHMPIWHKKNKREDLCLASYFSLEKEMLTFLVVGGSQGASALNELSPKAFSLLGEYAKEFQVVHITGNKKSVEEVQKAYEAGGIKAKVKPFETKMDHAWSFCDVAICRAGAGTVSELTLFEVPAILVPYPHAADKHQHHNASAVAQVGGGVLCEEKESAEKLAALLSPFLKEKHFLQAKKEAIASHKKHKRPYHLHQLVREAIGL